MGTFYRSVNSKEIFGKPECDYVNCISWVFIWHSLFSFEKYGSLQWSEVKRLGLRFNGGRCMAKWLTQVTGNSKNQPQGCPYHHPKPTANIRPCDTSWKGIRKGWQVWIDKFESKPSHKRSRIPGSISYESRANTSIFSSLNHSLKL